MIVLSFAYLRSLDHVGEAVIRLEQEDSTSNSACLREGAMVNKRLRTNSYKGVYEEGGQPRGRLDAVSSRRPEERGHQE